MIPPGAAHHAIISRFRQRATCTAVAAGRFNSPAEVRGEGYDTIVTTGWHATFLAASRVVFNGTDHPVVSDHYGVMIETQP